MRGQDTPPAWAQVWRRGVRARGRATPRPGRRPLRSTMTEARSSMRSARLSSPPSSSLVAAGLVWDRNLQEKNNSTADEEFLCKKKNFDCETKHGKTPYTCRTGASSAARDTSR